MSMIRPLATQRLHIRHSPSCLCSHIGPIPITTHTTRHARWPDIIILLVLHLKCLINVGVLYPHILRSSLLDWLLHPFLFHILTVLSENTFFHCFLEYLF